MQTFNFTFKKIIKNLISENRFERSNFIGLSIKNPYGIQPCAGEDACIIQWSYERYHTRLPKAEIVRVKNSDKMWSTWRSNGNPLQYLCHKKPMNSIKKAKNMTQEDELSMSEGVQYVTGEEQLQLQIATERLTWLGQSENDAPLWMCLVLKGNSNPEKNNIAEEHGPWKRVS